MFFFQFVHLISTFFLSNPIQLPEFFVDRLVRILSLGSVHCSYLSPAQLESNNSNLIGQDFDLEIESSNSDTRLGLSPDVDSSVPSKTLGRPVRQFIDGSIDVGGSFFGLDNAFNLDINLENLRQCSFRESFARLCFAKLLYHAFFVPISQSVGPNFANPDLVDWHDKLFKDIVPKLHDVKLINPTHTNMSVGVSRIAVQNILEQCRLTLVRFYQTSKLVGKCPLSR